MTSFHWALFKPRSINDLFPLVKNNIVFVYSVVIVCDTEVLFMQAAAAVPACTGPQSSTVCGALLTAKEERIIRVKLK